MTRPVDQVVVNKDVPTVETCYFSRLCVVVVIRLEFSCVNFISTSKDKTKTPLNIITGVTYFGRLPVRDLNSGGSD